MDKTSKPIDLCLRVPNFIESPEVHARIEVSFRLSTEKYVCLRQPEPTYSSPWNQYLFCEQCALIHLGLRLRQITAWHTLTRDPLGIYPVPCICCQKPLFQKRSAAECRECFEVALKETLEGRFSPSRELYHTHSHSFVSFILERTPLNLLQRPTPTSTECPQEHPKAQPEPSNSAFQN